MGHSLSIWEMGALAFMASLFPSSTEFMLSDLNAPQQRAVVVFLCRATGPLTPVTGTCGPLRKICSNSVRSLEREAGNTCRRSPEVAENRTLLLPSPRCKKRHCQRPRPRIPHKPCRRRSQREAGAAGARASPQSPLSPTCAPPRGDARRGRLAGKRAGSPRRLPVWGREDWRRLGRATLGEDGGIFASY